VAQTILHVVAAENAGARPLGSAGAVVGATVGATVGSAGVAHDLAVNGPLLAPGIGAQGATAGDLRAIFGAGLSVRKLSPVVNGDDLRCGCPVLLQNLNAL
jgi:orotidine-5'-phosphate decarboxylase